MKLFNQMTVLPLLHPQIKFSQISSSIFSHQNRKTTLTITNFKFARLGPKEHTQYTSSRFVFIRTDCPFITCPMLFLQYRFKSIKLICDQEKLQSFVSIMCFCNPNSEQLLELHQSMIALVRVCLFEK